MADSALQRKNMVESQVRPSDVTDRRITGAMQDVPRERFVPEAVSALAYMDDELAVAPGRSLMAPRTFARLVQLADLQASDKVLIIGALTGYSAAIVARLVREVVALEVDTGAATAAAATLADLNVANVTIVTGPLEAGWPSSAPYSAVIIEGAIERLPDELMAQLQPIGRLVAIENSGGVGRVTLIQAVGPTGKRTLSRRVAFEASAACLPGYDRPKAFAF
jgi:protein-L-isoaspartate(D-aspartate) O-methyltransferase